MITLMNQQRYNDLLLRPHLSLQFMLLQCEKMWTEEFQDTGCLGLALGHCRWCHRAGHQAKGGCQAAGVFRLALAAIGGSEHSCSCLPMKCLPGWLLHHSQLGSDHWPEVRPLWSRSQAPKPPLPLSASAALASALAEQQCAALGNRCRCQPG